ncbi:hypothetical protein BJ170DRAFT_134715 [Xylariales sp. AK1849]|nr:hypothetical protein BJ170DRAFT_134715 [Xylariales sp. AK1849]
MSYDRRTASAEGAVSQLWLQVGCYLRVAAAAYLCLTATRESKASNPTQFQLQALIQRLTRYIVASNQAMVKLGMDGTSRIWVCKDVQVESTIANRCVREGFLAGESTMHSRDLQTRSSGIQARCICYSSRIVGEVCSRVLREFGLSKVTAGYRSRYG